MKDFVELRVNLLGMVILLMLFPEGAGYFSITRCHLENKPIGLGFGLRFLSKLTLLKVYSNSETRKTSLTLFNRILLDVHN